MLLVNDFVKRKADGTIYFTTLSLNGWLLYMSVLLFLITFSFSGEMYEWLYLNIFERCGNVFIYVLFFCTPFKRWKRINVCYVWTIHQIKASLQTDDYSFSVVKKIAI